MRVLVTGGAGFIGSHIVDALWDRGHEVLVMDNFSTGRHANLPRGAQTFMPGDIVYRSDPWMGHPSRSNIFVAAQSFQPDVICHQAAQSSLRKSIDDPAQDVVTNVVGTLNVIEAAREVDAGIVFASTSAVYGNFYSNDIRPLHEGDRTLPIVPYGVSKLAAERYIISSGVPHIILRYGNVYGPRQVEVGENQLVPHCLAHMLGGLPFVVNGSGEQSRDFVYVEDVARANAVAIEHLSHGRRLITGIFNVSTGKATSVNSVVRALADLTNYRGKAAHGPAKAGESKCSVLDPSRARDHLGWESAVELGDGLQQTARAWVHGNTRGD